LLKTTGRRVLKSRNNPRPDPGRISKNRETCSYYHIQTSTGARRAPGGVSARGGAQSVEVGDLPFLESIFMIFGKSSAISAENDPLRTISSRNDQKLQKCPEKILIKTCRQPPRARGLPPAESGVLARPRKFGVVLTCMTFGVSPVAISLFSRGLNPCEMSFQ
jgi:hypothetical protein